MPMPLHGRARLAASRSCSRARPRWSCAARSTATIAFLTGHVPFLGALDDDPVRIILPGDGETAAAVHGGFVEVSDDNVWCSPTSPSSRTQIDVPRAEQAKQPGRGDPGHATPTTTRRRRRSPGPRPASRSPDVSSLLACARCERRLRPTLPPCAGGADAVACRRLRRARPVGVPPTETVADASFRRLGAWVDVFDYAPRLQNAGTEPRVTPDSVSTTWPRSASRRSTCRWPTPTARRRTSSPTAPSCARCSTRAHDRGIAVVPWFLPAAVAPADDLATMKQIVKLRVGGERFDGIGLDLESSEVPDIALRNRRTVAFARAGPRSSSARRCRWRRSSIRRCSSRCSTRRCGPTSRTGRSRSTSTSGCR